MSQMNATEIVRYIDHTLLKPDAQPAALDTLCAEAKQYNFKSVCVNSGWAAYVAEKLQGSDVAVCCVVGFPLGAMESRAKAFESARAVELGAQEIDMVINIGALKSGNLALVKEDMEAVRQAAPQPIILKVIIETCLLTDEEKATVCQLAKEIGADFVKTSTGFAGGGATVEDVALMRKTVGPDMGVKASGGVRDIAAAKAMIAAGATRLGTSSGIAIVTGAEGKEGY